jgi:hypothetical protein
MNLDSYSYIKWYNDYDMSNAYIIHKNHILGLSNWAMYQGMPCKVWFRENWQYA